MRPLAVAKRPGGGSYMLRSRSNRPLQRELPGFTFENRRDDWAVAGDPDVESLIPFAFDVDYLMGLLWCLPAFRRCNLSRRIELLHEQILHIGSKVCESPGDATIVPDDDKRESGKSYAFNVVFQAVAFGQMSFIPNVRNGVLDVHVIGEQRFAACGVHPRHDPVVRTRYAHFAGAIKGRSK